VVVMRKTRTSGCSGLIQPSRPNFDAAYAEQNSKPTSPAAEEIEIMCPSVLANDGRTARVTFIEPMRLAANGADLLRRQLLEYPHKSCRIVTSPSMRPNLVQPAASTAASAIGAAGARPSWTASKLVSMATSPEDTAACPGG